MNSSFFFNLALKISEGYAPDISEYERIINLDEKDVFLLFPGADFLRGKFFGRKIKFCTIRNSKSGKCVENCTFCAQSAHWKIPDTPSYPLVDFEEAVKGAKSACDSPVHRYSLVNSGRGPSEDEVKTIASYLSRFPKKKETSYCASLGLMSESDLITLKNSGMTRYHHNLESSESFFGNICTTHTYKDRVDTIMAAKSAGLEVCSGGIFGMGEENRHILELALDLKRLDVDAVPVNFLVPIKGTPLEKLELLRPSRCLKIISFLRYVLPDKEIIVCAGRESVIGAFQDMCIWAGANGIMTGNYLTVSGPALDRDLEMIRRQGFEVASKKSTT
ncbi:biotin synthase BioB [Desulforegula conservatrix]|uniref:biotin synthase BioB n=1 Tax=Desulforegula conservatrix TaxID=153026 RepID=UPI000406B660|nr:biotin synthase BioB [Desulforegula conservatrix]